LRRLRVHWLPLLCLGAIALFTALGVWQLQRRVWKLDLIARVTARVAAEPVAAPGPARWPGITAASDEYRRVQLRGHWLADREAAVLAVTIDGAGYWILTPLCTDEAGGWCVLVNRGFVPAEARSDAARVARRRALESVPGAVTGLLRVSEPRGGFLRRNDAAAGRWYSRDVLAIGTALRLTRWAPYFIDAEAAPSARASAPGAQPIAGLTVVKFRNAHLQYAITWFALALLSALGLRRSLSRGSSRTARARRARTGAAR